MAKIRIIAVEDDPLHEEKLRMNIEKLGYELLAVICDPEEVLSAIQASTPDIVLMDIDLSHEVSGIDLVNAINERFDIPVVYLTSFIDNRTFQEAKRTSPAAYVTKPFKMIELQSAIELAVNQRKKAAQELLSRTKKTGQQEHFFIKENNQLTQISLRKIMLVEAYDKYCNIYTPEKRYMLRARLKDLLTQLPESHFCQTHRSYVVSLDSIAHIDVSRGTVTIANKKVPVSKSFKENFFSRLNAIG
jgi:DNA-binding LytR/AlgR family response regulator